MSRFHFDETVMDTTVSGLGNVKKNIDNCISSLVKTAVTISMQCGFSTEGIFEDIDAERKTLEYCSKGLETGISTAVSVIQTVDKNYKPISSTDNGSDSDFSLKDMISEVVQNGIFGKVGAVGGTGTMIVSNVADIISGEDCTDAEYIYNVVSSGTKNLIALRTAAKTLSKKETVTVIDQIKALFGYASEAKTIGDIRLAKEFVGGGNIIGNILTLGSRLFNNMDEVASGKISPTRGTVETLCETGVKIAAGWAVKSAAMLAFGTPVGWGAVAVTVGVGAATVGANYLCKVISKKLTGEEKDIAEVVSDFYIDTAIKVGKTARKVGQAAVKAGKAVLDAGKSAINSISDGLNVLKSGFSPLFS